jgi:hypothetical protein
MMRETLAASNDHRDHEREMLPAEEKLLLSDDAVMCCESPSGEFEVAIEGYGLADEAADSALEECSAVC